MEPKTFKLWELEEGKIYKTGKNNSLYMVREKKLLWIHEANGELEESECTISDALSMEFTEYQEPPKTKKVKMLAYLDGGFLIWFIETRNPNSGAIRIPSEDKIIEVEE